MKRSVGAMHTHPYTDQNLDWTSRTSSLPFLNKYHVQILANKLLNSW